MWRVRAQSAARRARAALERNELLKRGAYKVGFRPNMEAAIERIAGAVMIKPQIDPVLFDALTEPFQAVWGRRP